MNLIIFFIVNEQYHTSFFKIVMSSKIKEYAELQNMILSIENDSEIDEIVDFVNNNSLLTNEEQTFIMIKLIASIASAKPNILDKICKLRDKLTFKEIKSTIYIDKIYDRNESDITSFESILINFLNQNNTESKLEEFKKHFLSTNDFTNAIDKDDIEKVQFLISQNNIDLNKCLPFVFEHIFFEFKLLNPVEYAAFKGSINSFKYLLLNTKVINYERLLECSVAGGNIEIIHIIENKHEKIYGNIKNNITLLYLAIEFMNNELIEYIIETYENEVDILCFIKCIEFSNYEAFLFLEYYDKYNELIDMDDYNSVKTINIAAKKYSFVFYEYLFEKIKLRYKKKNNRIIYEYENKYKKMKKRFDRKIGISQESDEDEDYYENEYD